jgi:hypothetical protein
MCIYCGTEKGKNEVQTDRGDVYYICDRCKKKLESVK